MSSRGIRKLDWISVVVSPQGFIANPQGTSFIRSTLLDLSTIPSFVKYIYIPNLIHFIHFNYKFRCFSLPLYTMNRRRSLPSRLQKARLVRTVDLNSTHRLDLVLAPKHSTPTSGAKDPDCPRLNTTFPTHLEIKFPTRTLSYTRAKASRPARTSSYSKALDCNASSASRLPSRSSSFVRQVRAVINSSLT